MSFGDIYWPLFLALISWSLVVEGFNFAAYWWRERRQAGMLRDLQEKYDRGEPFPSDFPLDQFDPIALATMLSRNTPGYGSPTVSGGAERGGSGQYL